MSASYRRQNGDVRNPQGGRAQWSNQAFTTEGLLQQCALPQIVKCNQQSLLLKRDSPLPVNLSQPLLLYDRRTVRKLLARNVIYDPVSHRYMENDETVVIPQDYEGTYQNKKYNCNNQHIHIHREYKSRSFKQHLKILISLPSL